MSLDFRLRSWELIHGQDVLHTGSAPKVAVRSIQIWTTQRNTVSPSDYTRNHYHLREEADLLLLSTTFYLTLGIICIVPWVDRGAPVWGLVYWSLCKERFTRRANFCNREAHVWRCDQLDVLCWPSGKTTASTRPWIAPVQIGRVSRKPFQTDPGAHPASSTTGTGSFSRR
jgi:hypothetical protein